MQPILIDYAAPGIENRNSELQALSDGKISMRISTLARGQDDIERETLLLLARDASSERDAYDYSGGEQTLLRTSGRAGIAKWIARHRGVEARAHHVGRVLEGAG